MNRTIKRIAIAAALSLPMSLVGQAAQATVITTWDYDVNTAFTSYSGTSGVGSVQGSQNNALFTAPTRLAWGPGAQPGGSGAESSLTIGNNNGGPGQVTGSDLMTNGAHISGATVAHDNQVIPGNSAYLNNGVLTTQLSLTPTAPPGVTPVTPNPIPVSFNINFIETQNSAPCAVDDNGPACSDIFVLGVDNADLTQPIQQQITDEDGNQYTVWLQLDGIRNLTPDECSAAGLTTPGCQGITTTEGNITSIASAFWITGPQTSVPEPGALSIMGLGLVGLALAGIRRNRKKS